MSGSAARNYEEAVAHSAFRRSVDWSCDPVDSPPVVARDPWSEHVLHCGLLRAGPNIDRLTVEKRTTSCTPTPSGSSSS